MRFYLLTSLHCNMTVGFKPPPVTCVHSVKGAGMSLEVIILMGLQVERKVI